MAGLGETNDGPRGPDIGWMLLSGEEDELMEDWQFCQRLSSRLSARARNDEAVDGVFQPVDLAVQHVDEAAQQGLALVAELSALDGDGTRRRSGIATPHASRLEALRRKPTTAGRSFQRTAPTFPKHSFVFALRRYDPAEIWRHRSAGRPARGWLPSLQRADLRAQSIFLNHCYIEHLSPMCQNPLPHIIANGPNYSSLWSDLL